MKAPMTTNKRLRPRADTDKNVTEPGTRRPKRLLQTVFIFLLFIPGAARANGIAPVLNFFHPDAWLGACLATLVIILLESLLLRWRLKGTSFPGALWRSLVLNIASSLTGSGLLLLFSRDSFFLWQTASFILPLFLITLVTEIPLLRVLFRAPELPWKRSILLGCGINITSYATVIFLEMGLLIGWFSYAGYLDRRDTEAWNNPQLLQQASGLIYNSGWAGPDCVLRVFDPHRGSWSSFANCPLMDRRGWDVEGDTFAFVEETTDGGNAANVSVVRLPDFQPILEITPSMFSKVNDNDGQRVIDLAISPDRTQLAVLMRTGETVAPKDTHSHYRLGDKCKLIVFSLVSGQETARASRWASDCKLCWFSDSRRILFSSFDDESLYGLKVNEKSSLVSYGIGYAAKGRFKSSLYAFDLRTGRSNYFADGFNPSLATATGDILIQDEVSVVLRDASGKLLQRVDVESIGSGGAVVSPSGKLILAEIERRSSFSPYGRFVLLDRSKPQVRHIVGENHGPRVDWTSEGKTLSSKSPLD